MIPNKFRHCSSNALKPVSAPEWRCWSWRWRWSQLIMHCALGVGHDLLSPIASIVGSHCQSVTSLFSQYHVSLISSQSSVSSQKQVFQNKTSNAVLSPSVNGTAQVSFVSHFVSQSCHMSHKSHQSVSLSLYSVQVRLKRCVTTISEWHSECSNSSVL